MMGNFRRGVTGPSQLLSVAGGERFDLDYVQPQPVHALRGTPLSVLVIRP